MKDQSWDNHIAFQSNILKIYLAGWLIPES